MNQYKTLLILGISLTSLSGCMQNSEPVTNKPDAAHQKCNTSHYLFPTHLKASRDPLHMIEVEQISYAMSEHKSLIKYVIHRCEEENVPIDVAFIPLLKSYYNPSYVLDGNAGLWQLDSITAQNLALTNTYWLDARKDIVESTDAILSYIKFLHYKLEGDWDLALVAYDIGLQPVLDAVNLAKSKGINPTIDTVNLNQEDKVILPKLQAVIYLAQHVNIQSADDLHTVSLPGQVELEKVSQVSGIDLDRLSFLNSGYKRPITDPDGPHRLLVDANDYQSLISLTKDVNKLRQVSKSNWSHHIVKKNENLSLIAHRFETSVYEIKRVNHLHSDVIHINQRLIIPDQTSQVKSKHVQNNHPGPKRILHIVTSKDTLYQLASKYRTSVSAIAHWNNLKKNAIHPEQTLTIWQYTPIDTARFYTVKPNDSLAKIARLHKTSISELKKANHLKNDTIHPNDRLVIPTKG